MAAGGVGFAVFGPRGEKQHASARGGGRIVLDYWEKWTRHEGDAMRRIVDAFNESQSRIFVRYVVTADIGQKSMVAIAGGAPPDLIGLFAFNVPGYAESGALLPLDDLAPRFGVTLEQYAVGVRPVMMHPGPEGKQWWACVNTAGSVALYYNRAAFREAGLDPDRGPATLAEFDEYHAKLTRRKGGRPGVGGSGPLERVGFFHPEPGWWSWIWAYHFGGSIFDRRSGRALVDSTENIAAMDWMQRYSRGLGVDEAQAFKEGFGNYFTPENPFLTGKVAMIVQGPWVANLIKEFKPGFDYGACAFPTVDAGGVGGGAPIGHIDTDVIVIPRGAKNPEASMEFIAWTQRQANVEQLARAHCKPSPLSSVSPEFLATHPNRGVKVHYDLFNSSRAFLAPRTRVWQQFKDEFDSAVQRVWRLEAPAAEIMGPLQARAQGFIDRAADEQRRRGAAHGGTA